MSLKNISILKFFQKITYKKIMTLENLKSENQIEKERTFRILIIDDDKTILLLAEEGLESKNHEIKTLLDPNSIDQIVLDIKEFNPDIIITDFSMHGIDGLTVIEEARERDIKTILNSSKVTIDDRLKKAQELADKVVKTKGDFNEMSKITEQIEEEITRFQPTTTLPENFDIH
jgi:CheY-like chemotaxis protein